jgi:hypothetical protein
VQIRDTRKEDSKRRSVPCVHFFKGVQTLLDKSTTQWQEGARPEDPIRHHRVPQ